jgi:hypothetical protein
MSRIKYRKTHRQQKPFEIGRKYFCGVPYRDLIAILRDNFKVGKKITLEKIAVFAQSEPEIELILQDNDNWLGDPPEKYKDERALVSGLCGMIHGIICSPWPFYVPEIAVVDDGLVILPAVDWQFCNECAGISGHKRQ